MQNQNKLIFGNMAGHQTERVAMQNWKTWQIISIVAIVLSVAAYKIGSDGIYGECSNMLDSNQVYIRCVSGFQPYVALGSLTFIISVVFLIFTAVKRKGFFSSGAFSVPTNTLKPILSTSPKQPSSDIQSELQKAADMLKQGLIDEDEYKDLKKKIISKS